MCCGRVYWGGVDRFDVKRWFGCIVGIVRIFEWYCWWFVVGFCCGIELKRVGWCVNKMVLGCV